METGCPEQTAILNEPPSPKPKTLRVRISRESLHSPTHGPQWKGDAEWSRGTAKKHHAHGQELAAPGQGEGCLLGDKGKPEDKAAPPSEIPRSLATSGYLNCQTKLLET